MSYPVPPNERVQDLRENIQAIKAEMAEASSSTASQKKPTLVLVSKLKPPSDLMAAYQNLEENERHFGENYVQEVGLLSAEASPIFAKAHSHALGSLQLVDKAKLVGV